MINGIKEEIVEILVEEHSMENFLKELLPTILPAGYRLDINCFIRVHEGKQHLKKGIIYLARYPIHPLL